MPDSKEILSKIATEATAALTDSVADGVAAKTSAAMSDVYSVALQALSEVKIQIENLEHTLELRRQMAMQEVAAFVVASSEALTFASSISRVITRLEQTPMARAGTIDAPPR